MTARPTIEVEYCRSAEFDATAHPFLVTRNAAPKADAPKVRYVVNQQGIILSAEFETTDPTVAQNIAGAVHTHNAERKQKLGNMPVIPVERK